MVKCPRCGYENASTSVYCDNCAYLLSDKNGQRINNAKKSSRWNIGLAKKIVIVLGIIVIALLLFSIVHNNSQPSHNDTLNVISDDGSQHQSSSYPFKVVINYNGSWYAKMGDPNYPIEKSGSNYGTFTLDCAAWDNVEITAQKYGGDGELQIQLLRNGKVVAKNSTANGSDSVTIKYYPN